jgi:D-sedoheptulose 7-phosphate isomerase
VVSELSLVQKRVEESISVKTALFVDQNALSQIVKVAQQCAKSLKQGGKIILAGNGGSFGDAQHISAEFTSKLMRDRIPLASIALGTNASAISAIGNDYGYEHVFARELQSIGSSNDVVILISTSGNSQNILLAAKVALENNIKVFGLTGQHGGQLAQLCECVTVPSPETARIQECHILIGHIIVEIAEMSFVES